MQPKGSSVCLVSALTLAGSALILGLYSPYYLPYVAHGFSPEKLHLTAELLYILLPWIVLSGIAQVLTYVLNAGEKFALPALVPLTMPMLIRVFVLAAGQSRSGLTLAFGSSIGSVVEVLLLLIMLQAHGTRLLWQWFGFTPELGIVMKQTAPLLAGGFLMASPYRPVSGGHAALGQRLCLWPMQTG